MNFLTILCSSFLAAAGLLSWQQQEIHRSREAAAVLKAQWAETRQGLLGDEDALAQLRQALHSTPKFPDLAATVAGTTLLSLTPESEGWWPTNQIYFYLSKRLLPLARLRDREMTPDEVVSAYGWKAEPDTYYEVKNRLFDGPNLSSFMAILLGLNPTETADVERIYGEFKANYYALEATLVQRVEPPEPIAARGGVIVARLPDMTEAVRPVLAEFEQALKHSIGESRTQLLLEQAESYFDEHLDKLGRVKREFVRHGEGQYYNLNVRYINPWGTSEAATTYNLPTFKNCPDWKYNHLFGTGAPCELK